ncbi:MAG: type VI secretion system contractile sheath large subunit [Elusimicrobia bacterium]|nr:MAG: type VI secretion system contractile sheath large subunit [Elusimicrobiota bacterium]
MPEITTDKALESLLSSVRLKSETKSFVPMIRDNFKEVKDQVSAEDRFVSSLAALLYNLDAEQAGKKFEKGKVLDLLSQVDNLINVQMNEILHNEKFQKVEAAWRGLEDLAQHTNFRANISIDILDVDKDELYQDFENNSSNVFGGALFEKIYIKEYDQYGGRPFGALIGQYEFENTPRDLFWLRNMAKVANAAHTPFVGAVSPSFFVPGISDVNEVAAIKDLDGLLNHPRFGKWREFRNTDEAAYIGLTFPRYVLRLPWHPDTNPCVRLHFTEQANGDAKKYLWGNTAILFARNLVKSFEGSGWCQYIRGPKGGGMIEGLPVDTFNLRGQDEIRPPVEVTIPDYREFEFAKGGFIPLVYRKDSADACFFSAQSAKAPKKFKDPKDSENSQLVCNLAYTFSITRIAHYVKSIMRDNIGSSADAVYIQRVLDSWIGGYVTQVSNPDDLTLRVYPFKASTVEVNAKPGEIGWYDCTVAVLPHLQFEGMNVELRLESRLGSAA